MKMTNKTIVKVSVGLVSAAMLLGSTTLAFAQNSTNAGVTKSTSKISAKAKMNQSTLVNNSNKKIDQRIKDLTDLSTRISEMKNVSTVQQTSLSNSIQTEITNLNTLKAKIGADTDMTTLKSDIQSISTDERTYMLMIPQARIIAAADKSTTIINMLTAMGGKLQTRISDAQAAGKDVTKLNAALTDFNAKLADATSLSTSIISGVSTLAPDQGNKTVAASNDAALKAARTNLGMITSDLKAARNDINTITKGVKGVGESAEVGDTPNSTSTGTSSAQNPTTATSVNQ